MEDHEIYFVKESGKMIVKDLEADERKKQSKKDTRKKEGYGLDSDTDSDEESSKVLKKGASAQELKKLIKS
jgi:hypothetical protein